MRIYIIGLAGSGKTTLAKQLNTKLNYPHLDLDTLFLKRQNGTTLRLCYEDVANDITKFMQQDSWIIEGVYPIEEVYQECDTILYLRTWVGVCIYRLWARYATDTSIRKKYGFIRSIQLTYFTVGRAMGIFEVLVYRDRPLVPFSQILDWKSRNQKNFYELRSQSDKQLLIQELT